MIEFNLFVIRVSQNHFNTITSRGMAVSGEEWRVKWAPALSLLFDSLSGSQIDDNLWSKVNLFNNYRVY